MELEPDTRVAADAGASTEDAPAQSAYSGPGDDKRGYADAHYLTRARSVEARSGRPADLVGLARAGALGLPPLAVPEHNPLTAEKVALGRTLFFDRRLSLNDTVSCAMCHIPEQGFTNNELATSIGFEGRTVRRNAPTLYNVAYQRRLFHDGRETALETQVWQPLVAQNEMANPSVGAVIEKIGRLPDYAGRFEAAFEGRGPGMETVGMALAAYQRTLISGASPFDRWYYGRDEAVVSASVERGFELFRGKAGCSGCHQVGDTFALFTDGAFHNTGVGWRNTMRKSESTVRVQLAPGVFVPVETDLIEAVAEPVPSDLGLYEITQDPADRWRYKTPSLRNVALTAPYMHDGSLATLEAVVAFYNRGGEPNPLLDPQVRPLELTAGESESLVDFLHALTGDSVPALVSDAFAAPIGDLGADDPHWSHRNRIEY
jgi:cytochrome c peroxidase